MYYANQIVYDLDAKEPVSCDSGTVQCGGLWSGHPRPRTTHFLRSVRGKSDLSKEDLDIATPKTVEEAKDLMNKGLIMPAPIAATHCWKCMFWLSHHPTKTCSGPDD